MRVEYEGLVAATAMIDAVIQILDDCDICHDERDALHDMRNDMNKDRVALLGNGAKRPFFVADLEIECEAGE
jgi:hypothetical protein